MKYKIILILSLISCMLGACARETTAQIESKKKNDRSIKDESVETINILEQLPQVYVNEVGNVVFDATVEKNGYDKANGLMISTVKLKKINEESAFKLLWRDEEYVDSSYEGKNEYGEDVVIKGGMDPLYMTSYECGPNSSQLNYTRSDPISYIIGAFRLEKKFDDYNADRYSLTKQLEFMTREEAFGVLEENLNQMELDFEKEYNAYALDKETLATEEYHMGMDGDVDYAAYKEKWLPEDECYYFSVRQTYQNIPVFYAYYKSFTDYGDDAYTTVQGIVSDKGIEQLMVDMVFEVVSSERIYKLVDFEEITEIVAKKYNNILGDETYKFNQIELVYIVDVNRGKGLYEMKPAWVFLGIQNSGGSIQTIIDAQTGEEIIL